MAKATRRRRRVRSTRYCRTCRKHLHLDHDCALAAAALYAAEHRGQYRPQRCPVSAGWHLTVAMDCRIPIDQTQEAR